jgi:flagellar protein FlbD
MCGGETDLGGQGPPNGGPSAFKSRARLPITQAEMIRLHKLGRVPQPFHLNPDLVITVEASPDTVVTLTTGSRLLVTETPEEVARAVRDWRAGVLDAMTRVPRRSSSLSLVRATAGDGAAPSLNAEAANHDEEHRP